MSDPNPKVPFINLCSLNVVKPGMMKAKQNNKSKKTKETLTTSPAMIVEKYANIRETMNAPQRKI